MPVHVTDMWKGADLLGNKTSIFFFLKFYTFMYEKQKKMKLLFTKLMYHLDHDSLFVQMGQTINKWSLCLCEPAREFTCQGN